MKKTNLYFIILLFCFSAQDALAQRDIIYKTDTTQIRCKILKTTTSKYEYAYADINGKVIKAGIQKGLVDSVRFNYYGSNLVQNRLFRKKVKQLPETIGSGQKKWLFNVGVGLDIGNIIEFNNPGSDDTKSLSGTCSIDAAANYSNASSRFAVTNELHYIFGLQKSALSGTAHLQKVTDNLNTLHDLSLAIGKNKKWNFNLIVRAATSIFTIYNGNYFKDINSAGKAQAFLSPYDITVSPGIKWQPDNYLRISISPYSFNLYGVKNQEISAAGVFISETDAAGNYKRNLFKRLGAEVNFWYDRSIKGWLDMQYRLGISSNYFEKLAKNGLLDGLFITRIKLIKNLFLTHRAILKGDFSLSPFKPYYNQSILLNYSLRF
jgi:hypothetical protein